MKKVYLEWSDSYSNDRWLYINDLIDQFKDPLIIKTVGYLVYENKNCVIIAGSLNEHQEMFCSIIHIPKKNIIKREELIIS